MLSCSRRIAIRSSYTDVNYINEVIKITLDGEDKFYNSSVFSITEFSDSLKHEFIVNREEDILGMSVVPDSVYIYFNEFKIVEDRLFLFNDESSNRANHEIFDTLSEFGYRLDSCLYKYSFLKQDNQKYFECSVESQNKTNIHPKHIKITFKRNSRTKKIKYSFNEYL